MSEEPDTDMAGPLDVTQASHLLAGIKAEQNRALELIHRHLARPTVTVIRRRAPGIPSADLADLYQDVLCAILSDARRHQYRPDGALLPFILKVARNKAIDHLRKRRPVTTTGSDLAEAIGEALKDTRVGEAWKAVVDQEENRRMMEDIRKSIAEMGYRQRQVAQVVIDSFPDRLSVKEIRDRIRRSTGELLTTVAVKRAWQEARAKIREELSRGGFLEGRNDE